MPVYIKKVFYVGVCIICFMGALCFFSPALKTDIFYIWLKGFNYIHYSFNKIVLGRPNPICYVDDHKVLDKIKNPPAWAVQQISSDFSPYTKFSVQDMQNTFDTISDANDANIIIKIAINDGAVTITKKDSVTLCAAAEFGLSIYKAIFEYALQKKYVSNVTFLLRFSDLFSKISSSKSIADFAPILAVAKDTSKNIEKNLVLIPDWMNLNSWCKLKPRIKIARSTFSWDKKTPVILWRGGFADVTGYRKKVVEYSKSTNSKVVDAKFAEDGDKYFMHPEQHLSHKYQLSIDGHTAPWERPIWQLYSNSVMIKHKSSLIQWYYNAIKPDQHYIEVTDNVGDLDIAVSKYTDEQLQRISQNANDFVENNLNTDDMVAYTILVLQKIEKMQ